MAITRICAIEGCGKVHAARGLCMRHYENARRSNRLPPKGDRVNPGVKREFAEAAVLYDGDDCLLWPFWRHSEGYGLFKVRQDNVFAHRFVCEKVHGTPPAERPLACHSCGNAACVNPRHLYWGDYSDNLRDAFKHGRRSRARSSTPPKLELTPKELEAAQRAFSRLIASIARQCRVDATIVRRALHND